ncbi:MAG: TatD family hydrolase [Myxococcota bacterium]
MFDSHCHITDLEAPDEALQAARRAGVRSLLTCGYDEPSNSLVCALSDRHPDLPYAIGLHPWYADQPVEPVLQRIRERMRGERRPTAVGEAGLDLWGKEPCHPLELQQTALEAQLQLAVELDLPVTLHSRKAAGALLPILRNHPRVRGALHAYSGSYEQLRPLLDLGMYVGIGGAVTRSRAKRVRRCAAAVPLDCILLETDAPAIGMDIVEPPHVRPAHLPRVRDALAELRQIDPLELEAVVDDNAKRLFRLKDSVCDQRT